MGLNVRHIRSGIEAVISDTHAATNRDIWVNTEDLPEALRQIDKLTDQHYNPKVYPNSDDDSRVCIRLHRLR